MSAPHHLSDTEVSVKAGKDYVVIDCDGDSIVIFHDEIDELCVILQKLKNK